MRFAVIGAGAIGGFVAAQLHRAGEAVTLVVRGEHARILREGGLDVHRPQERYRARPPVVDFEVPDTGLGAAGFDGGEDLVALLAVKSQHTAEAVAGVRDRLDVGAVVCLQNGVANEPTAARFVPNVYGACVLAPNVSLSPGAVFAYSDPVPGVLDIGRYCGGSQTQAARIADTFTAAGFASGVVADIAAVKYDKLVGNLGNAIEAVVSPSARRGPLDRAAQEEARRCFAAAGIRTDPRPERAALITPRPIDGRARPGASTWQSIQRGAATTETDYLNGEICLLGRRHGVATPVNDLLTRIIARRDRLGQWTQEELVRLAR